MAIISKFSQRRSLKILSYSRRLSFSRLNVRELGDLIARFGKYSSLNCKIGYASSFTNSPRLYHLHFVPYYHLHCNEIQLLTVRQLHLSFKLVLIIYMFKHFHLARKKATAISDFFSFLFYFRFCHPNLLFSLLLFHSYSRYSGCYFHIDFI